MARGIMKWLQYPRVVWLTISSQLYNSNRDIEWFLLQVMYPVHSLFNTGLKYAGPVSSYSA